MVEALDKEVSIHDVVLQGKFWFATLTWMRYLEELKILCPAETRDCLIADKIASRHEHFLASTLGRKI